MRGISIPHNSGGGGGQKTANRLNKFRKMRHDMVYRGEIATEKEAEQLKEIFKDLLKKLESEFDL